MAYATYDDYAIWGDSVSLKEFARYEFEAEIEIDRWTTTIDGVKKLRSYFPTDPVTVQAIIRCTLSLVEALKQIDTINQLSASEKGAITSESSGSESISYGRISTAIAGDENARRTYLGSIVKMYLSGQKDANGVNLLYGGEYPCIRTK